MTQALPSILQKIIQDKTTWIAEKQAQLPLASFQDQLERSDRDFYQAIQQGTTAQPVYILECKKASPSKGLIRSNFDLAEIADVYKHYASAISVLTDEKYFQGHFADIAQVRQRVTQPILCKDFILSEYQVYLARYAQADAILLMLSVLNDERYTQLATLAHQLGMGVLTETSNEAEFARALALKAKVIGVNNRNLHDLSVDIQRVAQITQHYADQIPPGTKIISESGIYQHQQIRDLRHVADGFLIGSSLMQQTELNHAVRSLLFGEHKVCGLTRPQDVRAVYQQGALYGGLIFVTHSKRCISLRQAQELVTQAPLRFVGVFQDQSIAFICHLATQLRLHAVQLHGNENHKFIRQLRDELPVNCEIWRAICIESSGTSPCQIVENEYIDRYIFDSKTHQQRGGTGKTFDWQLLPHHLKPKSMLAGGITPENIPLALAQGCLGLDLNSGLETYPGVKSHQKVVAAFAQLR
ncbi:TPA: bifunctional indole-3-glycerol-phosphate synthase TrpC/phosphoribosylanthranilate isomerase TrpF [Pasteurella multocida]|uniref:bifunctional indole-3-glycerol-phosphate synthase TrpC/phosphoribosylanthranilate isomerase TrpF n=1 Tax=Pasteurella multocida TaxID=747 RepID=UPI0028780B82|nr:bifunctional indole-3-glycerol-phosphate synthase TrpC/phosphoribosylanthranilate isomerase TrpF [Pasteurella multocida]MEB3484675.1 bifunctional indole-3-glycerol-phosphate synthase TrpC/phosphoribosylanthranilate isomerase TrpF [Pasteurella multocida]MEB3494452.1 bifunctional indole-3-glycerol-phosphate synthase TrpC/phosphoribosylanthranilate isomerase TrpF [Pasteurella multocida]MEB3503626.1 bifunctional indole-3-glycerol-phosphate synthase TrpC/phosphoribosylanthranilate isomerase TrpF [